MDHNKIGGMCDREGKTFLGKKYNYMGYAKTARQFSSQCGWSTERDYGPWGWGSELYRLAVTISYYI